MTNKTWQILYIMTMTAIAVIGCLCVASCAPYATTVQRSSVSYTERKPLSWYYNREAKIYVLSVEGPVSDCEIQVLDPIDGWRSVADYGLIVWWKDERAEAWIPDAKGKLKSANCWRVKEIRYTYEKSR